MTRAGVRSPSEDAGAPTRRPRPRGPGAAPRFDLPPQVIGAFDGFRTCELTTVGRDGTPVTWPAFPLYKADEGTFLFTTSIGLPQKAYNIRRHPQVSLLFSDATGAGIPAAPVVLVQGDATCPDELVTAMDEDLELIAHRIFERQPFSRHYGRDPVSRRLFGWYYLRLRIAVVPRRIRWWPAGDLSGPSLEVSRVA